MGRLSHASVEFARKHVTRFWDSDFFPKAFEFSALWANWEEVVDHLTSKDVNDLAVKTPKIMAAPKPAGSFRVVHQLDPLDPLVYTALAVTIAPAIVTTGSDWVPISPGSPVPGSRACGACLGAFRP